MNKKLIILGFLLIIGGVILTLNNSFSYFGASNTYTGSITVPEDNYCINNGITNLSDCLLVMENYAASPEEAKTYIESKGEANTSQTAPTLIYREITTEVSDTENGILSTTAHYTIGKKYTFNQNTGMFTIQEYNNNELTDEYLNYYTCGPTTSTQISCSTLYQIKAYEKVTVSDTTTYKITQAIRHNYSELESFDSEIGLYATQDNEGTTYFYRGNVQNNYVSFAGYIWRIVRINGNRSIRLIYSGTSTNASGNETSIGTSQYYQKAYDPTYLGYQYHENLSLKDNQTITNYNNLTDNKIYYYSDSYTFNKETRQFSLTGNKISGTWKSVNQEVIANYPYTCRSESENGTCVFLLRMKEYSSPSSAKVNYITYSSVDYPSILNNTDNSTIKEKIDNWFATNIQNKQDNNGTSYSSYLSDEIFCNDRTFTSGDGYSISKRTEFSSYYRNVRQKKPNLICNQTQDKFTVSSNNGNGKLTYPVGLLTIDEVALAGGVYLAVNNKYYLATGQPYWTMSPVVFDSNYAYAYTGNISAAGHITTATATTSYGVRPVINLSPDILITGGDGTKNNPYTVALPNN